eukprot:TRINITY_DN93023_c0_g1_i1.p1 TRINITY_DN93023_c0_g1~~TRINITY_DN93023_c0_g1_i1.p1  ORF type:complete len:341 (-),score=49.88 TRINITY_DN93023_c0_g1_i1:53-1075(-)
MADGDMLYIQNMPLDVTEETIKQIFAAVGYRVQQSKVLQGKAMVRFESPAEAKLVLESFDGTLLPGFDNPLQIRYASRPGGAQPAARPAGVIPMPPVAGGCGGYGKFPVAKPPALTQPGWGQPYGQPYGQVQPAVPAVPAIPAVPAVAGSDPQPTDNLYIKGLPPTADEAFVKELFNQYSTVTTCKVLRRHPGEPCHALVRFQTVEAATSIKNQLDGGILEGHTNALEIKYATQKKMHPMSFAGNPFGGGLGTDTEAMLDEWVKAKRFRDFATADSLRAQLRGMGIDPDVVRPAFPESPEKMLDEWVKAKRTRDFATADAIRVQLRAQGIDPDTCRPNTM